MKATPWGVVLAVITTACGISTESTPQTEVPSELSVPTGEPSTWEGEWFRPDSKLPDDELVPTIVVAGGTALVVYEQNGGRTVVGEMYDPVTGEATRFSPSGLVWRANAAIVWSGRELLIAGGDNGPGIDRVAAAYDPETGSWRDLPDPPGHVTEPAVWTGTELLAFASRLAFDPLTDMWRATAEMPGPARAFPAVVWTGTDLIVWGGCDAGIAQCDDMGEGALGSGMRYDPGLDEWTPLSPSPLAPGMHPKAVWTGSEVLVFAGLASPDDGALAAAYDPSLDRWRRLPNPPISPRMYAGTAWTGRHWVIWGGSAVESDGAAFDTVSEEWLVMPPPPPGSARDRHAMAWVGGQLHIVGGWQTNGPLAFRPEL